MRPTPHSYKFYPDTCFFRGELNNAKPSSTKFTPGDPGCWWIKTGDFIDATGLDMMTDITDELILEVPSVLPFHCPHISDKSLTDSLENVQRP